MPINPDAIPLVVAFVALLVGLLGAVVSVAAILQKGRADRREALWERATLAIRMSQSERPRERLLGSEMVKLLLGQDDLSESDAALLVAASEAAIVDGQLTDAGQDESAAVGALADGTNLARVLDERREEAHHEVDDRKA